MEANDPTIHLRRVLLCRLLPSATVVKGLEQHLASAALAARPRRAFAAIDNQLTYRPDLRSSGTGLSASVALVLRMEHPTVGPPSQFSDFNIFIPKTIMFTKTVDRAIDARFINKLHVSILKSFETIERFGKDCAFFFLDDRTFRV